jgi:glyoxalase family protein
VLSVRDVGEQESFLTEALGFRKIGVDGPYHRFEIPGAGRARILDLHHEPDRAGGSWGFGAGTVHHVAFNVETDEALLRQKAIYEELGLTDASELKDRYYFHSLYVRSPGGILIECTANVPGGFYQDESFEELGTKLHVPPWYEDQREAIVAMLEPIVVPEANRPGGGAITAEPPAGRAAQSGVVLSRTKPRFTADTR